MSTNRCVKWSEDARKFFNSAEDKSVVLDIIISHWCISQTGEGFEELINSINSEEIRRKIKKVNILDTSYLYRHCIPEFEKYSDTSLSTVWFLANKYAIEQLLVDCSMNFWADEINSDVFEYWYKRIRTDFAGNENGVGIVQEFRDLVIKTAAIFSYKNNGVFNGCVDFLLEECAHACAYLGDKIVVYPISLGDIPITFVIERYNMGIHQLSYKVSSSSQMRYKSHLKNSEKIDIEVASFMKNDVSNVNFFVVDKYGNFIYRNYAFNKIIGDITAERLDPKSWEVSKEVMRYGKQIIVEEEFDGTYYLSMKAPMIIDGEVEGIIGLAINVTDHKKTEQLEFQNKLQETELKEREKFQIIADQVAQDIKSPLQTLDIALRLGAKYLPEREYMALRDSAHSIRKTMQTFLEYSSDIKENLVYRHILVSQAIAEIIERKKHHHFGENVEFQYTFDSTINPTFIYGDITSFERMMSNVINNSIEACEGKNGVVEIGFAADDNNVNITIQDNGKGMSQEMVKKLMQNEDVAATKVGGFGIGTSQIREALKEFNGAQFIESTPNVGTKITLIIPKSARPA